MEKVWWDVTSVYCSHPVTQCHVGRLGRSLSLFAETSYNSRLGGLCTDQSSVIDANEDLRHQSIKARWVPGTHIKIWASLRTSVPWRSTAERDIRHRTSMSDGDDGPRKRSPATTKAVSHKWYELRYRSVVRHRPSS